MEYSCQTQSPRLNVIICHGKLQILLRLRLCEYFVYISCPIPIGNISQRLFRIHCKQLGSHQSHCEKCGNDFAKSGNIKKQIRLGHEPRRLNSHQCETCKYKFPKSCVETIFQKGETQRST